MTCGDPFESPTEGTTNYGLFNKKLDTSLTKQVWIKEEVTDGEPVPGAYRLRNMWNNNNSDPKYYLTRSVSTGDSHTFCKTAVSDSRKQLWFVD